MATKTTEESHDHIDLTGLIDIHVHSAPDVRPRLLDDLEVAQAARAAGMRAVMLKSHVTLTADRAAIAEKVTPGIHVLGGLVLNQPVGGLNPAAVEVAIRMGARQIWMPTISAASHISFYNRRGIHAPIHTEPAITILQEDGRLVPAVHEILDLVAEADIIISTAHLSPDEVMTLVPEARAHGVRHIVVTHPEAASSGISLEMQQELAQPGVWFEHCYVSSLEDRTVTYASIARRIRAVGIEHVVLSTDLGIAGFPLPVDGMRAYLAELMALGFSWDELLRMTRDNPAELLDL